LMRNHYKKKNILNINEDKTMTMLITGMYYTEHATKCDDTVRFIIFLFQF